MAMTRFDDGILPPDWSGFDNGCRDGNANRQNMVNYNRDGTVRINCETQNPM